MHNYFVCAQNFKDSKFKPICEVFAGMLKLLLTACPLTNLFEGTCTPRGWILGVQGIF